MNDIAELSAMGVMNLMPSNKEQVARFVDIISEQAIDGYVDPIQLAVQLKTMEEVVSRLRKDKRIVDIILSEIDKYGKKASYQGAEVTVRENGTRYDYSVCQDSEHDQLVSDIERLTARLKEREAFLKSIKPGYPVVNEETGEVHYAPIKTSTTGVVVTL